MAIVITGEQFVEKLQVETFQLEYVPQLSPDGISSFTMDISLTRNALVRVYDVVLQAKRASATPVATVAQVRVMPGSASETGMAIVLDFGTPRTVSGVQVPLGLTIARVTPWIGTAFAPKPVYGKDTAGSSRTAILPSEIRTERLLVEVSGKKSGAELSSQMVVVLPESPSDLEVRIDGGAPVARFPGPAQPGSDSALSDQAWNKDGERIVHLADALAKLTGDPTHPETVTFKVVLSSRVPGELHVKNHGTPSLSYVRRVVFGADTSKELVFAEEGTQEIALAGAKPAIEEIRFTAAGTFPPERIIPPDGPENANLADLILNPDRAVCVRLRSGTGLAELTGVRLPLLAGGGGAEMRVVLWRNKDSGSLEPVEAMPDGVSEPVTLPAGSGTENWTTFSFKRPVPLTSENPPWAALLVSRGEVTWGLGASSGASDPLDANKIRRGAPEGPWKPLPTPFQSGTTGIGAARGRIRMIGHAPKDVPLAPLLVSIGSSTQTEVTPAAKGTAAKLGFSPLITASAPVLRVTSRVPGNATLRDLDVVSTT